MTKPLERARAAFYQGSRDIAPLVVNDAVEVTEGEHRGARGAVISIEQITPEPVYLVEFGDGPGDLLVPLRLLRLIQ